MTTVPITLLDWRAWQPGRAAHDDTRLSVEPLPVGESVPAMLRRRLNAPGRAVCDMLASLDPGAECVLLHASRHGDGERTLEMLYALSEHQPLSPARFGMSVHNAILGVHSIASGNRRSLQAIAASGAEVAALFSEARGFLAGGEREVIAVFSEAPIPERFLPHVAEPPELAAVALRLGIQAAPGEGQRLDCHAVTAVPAQRAPQPADVIAWLLGESALVCPTRQVAWTLAS